MARYRLWVLGLTLTQYILFMAVVSFAVTTVVDAATSAVLGPFSWPGVVVWTVLMTGFFTWWRQGSLPQGKEHPAARTMTRRGLNLKQLVACPFT